MRNVPAANQAWVAECWIHHKAQDPIVQTKTILQNLSLHTGKSRHSFFTLLPPFCHRYKSSNLNLGCGVRKILIQNRRCLLSKGITGFTWHRHTGRCTHHLCWVQPWSSVTLTRVPGTPGHVTSTPHVTTSTSPEPCPCGPPASSHTPASCAGTERVLRPWQEQPPRERPQGCPPRVA